MLKSKIPSNGLANGLSWLIEILAAVWYAAVGIGMGSPTRAAEPGFGPGVAVGRVTDDRVTEASGLAASRKNPGVLWTHNDAGSAPRLFALSTNGTLLATLDVAQAQPGDFEDIAIGPGPRPEVDYLYFADIGDNDVDRDDVRVYRIPEPAVYGYWVAHPVSEVAPEGTEIVLRYPDGPHDAEALMVDPLSGDLFIAVKQAGGSQIYRATKVQIESGSPVQLEWVRDIGFELVSGGDISPDGTLIALRREDFAQLWIRSPGESVGDALGRPPISIPVIGPPTEPNGEAIAFHPTGLGYYTISEGKEPRLYFFPRTSADAPPQPITLLPPGSTWRYLDDGSDPPAAWRLPDFAPVGWKAGDGQFGYGQGDERTIIDFGKSANEKPVTTCFRTTFEGVDPRALASLQLTLLFDDGVAVYLNGTEVLRQNLNAAASPAAPATADNSRFENVWMSYPLSPATLQPGTNTLAVEVHRYSRSEEDLSFDLQLASVPAAVSPDGMPLRFTHPPRWQDNAWDLEFTGPPGFTVNVEGNSNTGTADWHMLGSVILTNGTGAFLHQPRSGAGQFYRLRL